MGCRRTQQNQSSPNDTSTIFVIDCMQILEIPWFIMKVSKINQEEEGRAEQENRIAN
jgi:hypothetical protein